MPATLAKILRGRKPTVLVVDDQERNIQLVGTLLQLFNYEIVPATSGEQALKRVASRVPDLILLDVLMPGIASCVTCHSPKGKVVAECLTCHSYHAPASLTATETRLGQKAATARRQ